jgi:hypothetical protein
MLSENPALIMTSYPDKRRLASSGSSFVVLTAQDVTMMCSVPWLYAAIWRTRGQVLLERIPDGMAAAVTEIDLLVDRLVVEPMGWNKVWSLRTRIDIPYGDIVAVEQDRRLAENGPAGLRFPGANIPGVYLAGTFWKFWGDRKSRSFWLRRRADRCITIRLRNNSFDYVTVDVADPAAEIRRITSSLLDRGIVLGAPDALAPV